MSKKKKIKFVQGPPGPQGPIGLTGAMGRPGQDCSPRETNVLPLFVKICRWMIFGTIVLCIAFAIFLIGVASAHAQEEDMSPRSMYNTPAPQNHDHWHHDAHSQFHDVYKTWCQPGSKKPCDKTHSCCDAREEADGKVEGHCYWTQAELRKSKDPLIKYMIWWTLLDDYTWEEIPENRIIREKNPEETGTAAHVCETTQNHVILCFLPPTGVQ